MCALRQCILKSLSSNNPIVLTQNKEFYLGRGPSTEIIDSKVSKRQVSVVADVIACTVLVHCLGGNPSVVNGRKLKKNESVTVQHKGRLELLAGQHIYEVEFIPPPTEVKNTTDTNSSREETKVIDDSEEAPSKRIKLSSEENCEKNHSRSESVASSGWENVEKEKLLVYTKEGTTSSEKIAAYDLDGTLIVTKSGKVLPVDTNDWQLFNPAVKPALRKHVDNGFRIVIFTNQAGISKGKINVTDFKSKIEKIVKALEVPIQVFIATSDGMCRKPTTGMWNELVQKRNSGLVCNMTESFYVGDAAGRIVNWMPKRKKDFSCVDRLFALNVGLRFQTPEAHFFKQSEGKYEMPAFDPTKLFSNTSVSDVNIISNSKEVVILVGSQGSGKSFFANRYLVKAGYCYVNRDTLGSWQRCVASVETALREGRSVVVDNTNPDKASRKRYIDIAANLNTPCRCFVMDSSTDHARHNNKFRQLVGDPHVEVNDIMIYSYKKKYEPPTKEEGFTNIVTINFVPKFDDPEREKLYQSFLLEK